MEKSHQVFCRKHISLVFILGLVAFGIYLLPRWNTIDHPNIYYCNLMVSLSLLLNHIATAYAQKGSASKVMKTVSFLWLVLIMAYISWMLAH